MNTSYHIKRIMLALSATAGVFLGSFLLASAASTFIVQQGGTGANTFSAGLVGANGTNPLYAGIATTTVSCGTGASCTTFVAIGGSPVTITATVGGSGTVSTSTPLISGQVDFSTGVNTIGNDSNFFWDNTNKFLGIGTSTPGSLLSIGNTSGINFTGATSTFKTTGGVDITNGCFSVTGVCLQTYIQNSTAYKSAANYATAAVLGGTPTYNNGTSGVGATLTEVGTGALSVDGSNPAVSNRVLVKDQVDQTTNGVYTVTATGSGIASYILTRATDFNTSVDIFAGVTVPVLSGTANAGTSWVQTTTGVITLGSSNIVFVEGSAAGGGVASLKQTYGTAQTGALTLASSTAAINNDWGITNSGTTFTLNLPTATASIRGLLSGTDWTTFNGKQAAILGTIGQIDYFTGTNALAGTSTITIDTNSFVGIGSTSPKFQLGINAGAGQSPFAIGSSTNTLAWIDTLGKFWLWDVINKWSGILSPTRSFVLGTATTTTWIATSTGAYAPTLAMPFAGTIKQARCNATSTQAFLGTAVYVNQTLITPNYFISSSTVGTEKFTAGNTFVAGDIVTAYFGTTTTDANAKSVSCTFDVIQTS